MKRWLWCVVLFSVGCSAQPPASAGSDAELNQRLVRHVRVQYSVPMHVEIKVGERRPSDFPGYDAVDITLSDGQNDNAFEFLLARDGSTLVRLNKMDISRDPYAEIMRQIDLSGRPSRGADDAKVVIVSYNDLQCPFCAVMHRSLFQDVMIDYRDRVRVLYKDFPLQSWARRAAINANCLLQQDAAAYWAYADALHPRHREISQQQPRTAQQAELDRMATEVGAARSLDTKRLAECLRQQPDDAVRASLEEGTALGVKATPTLFVNGMKVEGAIPAAQLRLVLDRALREAGVEPPAAAVAAAVEE